MRRIVLGLALLAPGCGVTSREDVSDEGRAQQILARYRVTASEEARIKSVYPDIYLHIQDWREAFLDHADRSSLLYVRQQLTNRVKDLEARDAELVTRPPYVVIDARREVKEQIAFEVERLRLLQDRLDKTP